jgi:hypothetical protein
MAAMQCQPCYNARMTDDKPTTPPRKPLVLPPNGRDVTAEKVGTVMAIVGAPKPPKDKPK